MLCCVEIVQMYSQHTAARMFVWITKTITTNVLIGLMLSGLSVSNSLRVCPCDTIEYPGQSVLLQCGSQKHHMLRWYRDRELVFDGINVVDDAAKDGRYHVNDDGNGSFNLNITNVKPGDAGTYTCLDVYTAKETAARLVIVDQPSNLCQTINQQQLSVVRSECSFTVYGQLKPVAVEWLNKSEEVLDGVSSQTSIKDDVIKSTTNDSRAVECRLRFNLSSSCGQHVEPKYFPSKKSEQQQQRNEMSQRTGLPHCQQIRELTIAVMSLGAAVVIVSLVSVICCLWCITRKTREGKTDFPKNAVSPVDRADVSLSVTKPPTSVTVEVYDNATSDEASTDALLDDEVNEDVVTTEDTGYSHLQFRVYESLINTPTSDSSQQDSTQRPASYMVADD